MATFTTTHVATNVALVAATRGNVPSGDGGFDGLVFAILFWAFILLHVWAFIYRSNRLEEKRRKRWWTVTHGMGSRVTRKPIIRPPQENLNVRWSGPMCNPDGSSRNPNTVKNKKPVDLG